MQRRRRLHHHHHDQRQRQHRCTSHSTTACTTTQPIRHIRFRTKIAATRRAPSTENVPTCAAATQQDNTTTATNHSNQPPHSTADQRKRHQRRRNYLSTYEVSCRINYGDFRQVHVQFHTNSRKRCAFSWKRKLRQVPMASTAPPSAAWRGKSSAKTTTSSTATSSISTTPSTSSSLSLSSNEPPQLNCDECNFNQTIRKVDYDDDDVDYVDDVEDDDAYDDVVDFYDDYDDDLDDDVFLAAGEREFCVKSPAFRNYSDYYPSNISTHRIESFADADTTVHQHHDRHQTHQHHQHHHVRNKTEIGITAEVGDGGTTATTAEVNGGAGSRGVGGIAQVNSVAVVNGRKHQEIAPDPLNCEESLNYDDDDGKTSINGGDVGNCGDHNRFIDTQQSSISKNGSKPETPTDFNDITNNGGSAIGGGSGVAIHHNNNSSNNKNNNLARTSVSPILGVPRGGSVGGSVVGSGGGHGKKLINNESNGGVMLLDKKTPSKVQTTRKLLFQRNAAQQQQQQQQHQHQHQQQQQLHKQHSIEDSPQTPTSGEYLDASELQRLKLLNRHSCNGRLDYESLERHLQQAELVKQQQDKGVEALGVMLQYLVYDLDAFSCPSAKSESAKAKESLSKTLNLLEEAKSACTELQDQLCDKEAYYTQREEELQALHRCELEKAKSNVSEIQMLAKEKISAVETKLAAKDAENKRALDCYRLEMDNKCAQKQEQLAMAESRERALKERLSLLESSEKALREQATEAEQSYGARLQAAAAREHELNERVKVLSRELDQLRDAKEHRERELRDKLNLSQDEISVLRSSHRSSLNESLDRSTSPRNSSNAMSQEVSRLQHESESLRCVLELKQKEISKLSKQNEELMRDATERASLQAKISLLESRNELLQSEIIIKAEKEKEFQRQMEDMQKSYNHESTKRTRLSYDNEALQWQLKQRSEQLHIVEAKLQELSANEHQLGSTMNSSNLSFVNRLSQNGSSMVDECSPPTSPVVKGVIKKPDSVSWVLEMDDETPEAAATKMVKRAGSFRSVERSPSIRRQLSVSASAASSTNTINGSSVGPNPLSQSMSATSVIRQHSNDVGAEFSNRSHLRIRSKSVSVKCSDPVASSAKNDKKLSRQHSSGNSRKNELVVSTWKEPISASSPYSAMRPRPSARCHDATTSCQDALLLRRPSSSSSTSRKLITCDTSTLNSGEKLEMRSLPTHPSVHDLKMLKKCQEIQESAGEAMLSGTNSEDEGCSASSDEIISSASTSSRTTGSTSSLNHIQNPHMSLEDVLQIEKINSLNGTPMEMSWSDDAEVFTNTSTV